MFCIYFAAAFGLTQIQPNLFKEWCYESEKTHTGTYRCLRGSAVAWRVLWVWRTSTNGMQVRATRSVDFAFYNHCSGIRLLYAFNTAYNQCTCTKKLKHKTHSKPQCYRRTLLTNGKGNLQKILFKTHCWAVILRDSLSEICGLYHKNRNISDLVFRQTEYSNVSMCLCISK